MFNSVNFIFISTSFNGYARLSIVKRACYSKQFYPFLIRPFATMLLFRNEDITTDAAILLPFAIFGGC